MAITTRIIHSLDGLGLISKEWNVLALRSPHKSPLLSWSWLSVFFECCIKPNQTWYVVLAQDDKGLAGVLPLVVRPISILGVRRYILSTPHDNQTTSVDMIVRDQACADVCDALVRAAFAQTRKALFIELYRIDTVSWSYQALASGKHAFRVLDEYCQNGAFISLKGDYDEYRASLKKNFKSNLKKASNKLKKMPDVSFEIKEDGNVKAEDLDQMLKVEGSGWKGKEGSAISSSTDAVNFYQRLARKLSEQGWMAFHFLKADDTTLAANFSINFAGSTLLWKLGYLDEYSKCSPGNLLMEYLVREKYTDPGTSRIDLMTDYQWYDNWNMDRRPFHSIWIYGAGFPAFVFFTIKWGKHALRKVPWLLRLKRKLFDD